MKSKSMTRVCIDKTTDSFLMKKEKEKRKRKDKPGGFDQGKGK